MDEIRCKLEISIHEISVQSTLNPKPQGLVPRLLRFKLHYV